MLGKIRKMSENAALLKTEKVISKNGKTIEQFERPKNFGWEKNGKKKWVIFKDGKKE